MPAENLFHEQTCHCAMHNGGGDAPPSHSDGCPRVRPVVRPRSVMLRWPQDPMASAAVKAFVQADAPREWFSRLPAATAAFLTAPITETPALVVTTAEPERHGSAPVVVQNEGDAVDSLIDTIAPRVQALTPSGTPGIVIETAIASTLERVERVVFDLESRLGRLVDQEQVTEMNARIDRLVSDIPVTAAAAVNEALAAVQVQGFDFATVSDEVRKTVCGQILDQIPQVVDNYLASRST